MSETNHQTIKEAVGIKQANCFTCARLGHEESVPICNKIERYGYLKSFPFSKEMKCWEPEFWHSKFADEIEEGTSEELDAAYQNFKATVDVVKTGRDATATVQKDVS